MLKGNLVNWDTARFELYNMTEESAPVDMVGNDFNTVSSTY